LNLDVEIHHLEIAHPLEFSNVAVVSQGPLRAEVKYGQSTISVTVCTFFLERLGELDGIYPFVDLSRRHGRFVLFYKCFLILKF